MQLYFEILTPPTRIKFVGRTRSSRTTYQKPIRRHYA